MSLATQRARVGEASRRVTAARIEFLSPTHALLARGERSPLTAMGIFAGIGFVLGQFNVHLPRLPGVGALLGGGLLEIAGHGMQLFGIGGDSAQP